MRLTPQQRAIIRASVREFYGEGATVWLFGSRVDDRRRGGDIDLLIETEHRDMEEAMRAEIALLTKLKRQLGEQKIDILLDYPGRKYRPPIFTVARQQGVKL